MTYAERATRYARAVVAGDQPACRYVRMACERHLADLADTTSRYEFSADAVARVCGYLEALPHVKGRWARSKETLKLEDWQCFMVGVPFGWLRKADGLRRFRRVYVEVPRKNAKSTITAGLGLYMLTADGEHGAEVYSGAGTEKQAWEVFGPARLMAKNTPQLLEAFDVTVGAKNLHIEETASKFEPIIGKPGDGSSPTFAITDEYHEHTTPEQYDTMVTGMGSREQPMSWVITTAGDNTEGPCYALRQDVVDVLDGKVENDQLFGLIYTIDDGDDWADPAVLAKANPNFGVSVMAEYLEAQQQQAINSPRRQATFKTKHLNAWVTARAPYFNAHKWSTELEYKETDLAGRSCFVGIDLAAKHDIAAVVHLFEPEGDGPWHVTSKLYLPEEKVASKDAMHFRQWVDAGWITTHPGVLIDYEEIAVDLEEYLTDKALRELCYDQWQATQFVTRFERNGVTCVQIPQTTQYLSQPMKELYGWIESGRVTHDGNPCFAWMIGNVTGKEDAKGNVYPRKESAERKIDGPVALLNAMARATRLATASKSVYEEEGIFFL